MASLGWPYMQMCMGIFPPIIARGDRHTHETSKGFVMSEAEHGGVPFPMQHWHGTAER